MAIELSNLTFTEQEDMFPLDEEEEIYNNGITNTLAGNDLIIGTGDFTNSYPSYGISNIGSIYTGNGDDIIIGLTDHSFSPYPLVIFNHKH